jgi:hypothetical protein
MTHKTGEIGGGLRKEETSSDFFGLPLVFLGSLFGFFLEESHEPSPSVVLLSFVFMSKIQQLPRTLRNNSLN